MEIANNDDNPTNNKPFLYFEKLLGIDIEDKQRDENGNPILKISDKFFQYEIDQDQKLYDDNCIFKSKNKLIQKYKQPGAEIAPVRQPKLFKKLRQLEQGKTLGDKWSSMTLQELTPELKNEMKLLSLSQYLDPTTFKKNDMTTSPRYFQVGTYMPGGDDFTAVKMSKKAKGKKNIVDSFIEYDKDVMYSRKQFQAIQTKKQNVFAKSAGTKKMNRLRKMSRKKFKRH